MTSKRDTSARPFSLKQQQRNKISCSGATVHAIAATSTDTVYTTAAAAAESSIATVHTTGAAASSTDTVHTTAAAAAAVVGAYAANVSVARRLKINDVIALDAFTVAMKESPDDDSILLPNLIIHRLRVVDEATPLPLGQVRPHADPSKYAQLSISAEEWRARCAHVVDDVVVGVVGDVGGDDEEDDDDDDRQSVASLLPPIVVPCDVDRDIYEGLPMPGLPRDQFPIRCDGTGCSLHGTVQGQCIVLECPPANLSDADLIEAYPFFVDPNLTAGLRRALRYYFYATCVYGARGAGNRVELPHCLVSRIRFEIPNLKGVPYIEYVAR
jgi:hypothetical protein